MVPNEGIVKPSFYIRAIGMSPKIPSNSTIFLANTTTPRHKIEFPKWESHLTGGFSLKPLKVVLDQSACDKLMFSSDSPSQPQLKRRAMDLNPSPVWPIVTLGYCRFDVVWPQDMSLVPNIVADPEYDF